LSFVLVLVQVLVLAGAGREVDVEAQSRLILGELLACRENHRKIGVRVKVEPSQPAARSNDQSQS
jgi:hypothetical protein